MNNRAAEKAARIEDNHNRHCSYSGSARDGVVLHSAKQRATIFVPGGRPAAAFVAQWFSRNSQEQRDALVESYFI